MRLIDLEGDTNFTLQNQSLPTTYTSPFLAWGDFHVRSGFTRSTIPEEKWGTTHSLLKL